jgi:hypothetical protein
MHVKRVRESIQEHDASHQRRVLGTYLLVRVHQMLLVATQRAPELVDVKLPVPRISCRRRERVERLHAERAPAERC